jgi:Flp pilus assembly CpaF family ATPase
MAERDWLLREFVQEVMEFGPITALLNDPAISKITINSAQEVWIERLDSLSTHRSPFATKTMC